MSETAPAPLLSIEEVAAWLGFSPNTLYNLRHRGEGPPSFRVSGRVRYDRAAVEKWLDAQREQPAASPAPA